MINQQTRAFDSNLRSCVTLRKLLQRTAWWRKASMNGLMAVVDMIKTETGSSFHTNWCYSELGTYIVAQDHQYVLSSQKRNAFWNRHACSLRKQSRTDSKGSLLVHACLVPEETLPLCRSLLFHTAGDECQENYLQLSSNTGLHGLLPATPIIRFLIFICKQGVSVSPSSQPRED